MKFISWNVNGLRAVAGKGFADIFKELDADFFCLQETICRLFDAGDRSLIGVLPDADRIFQFR